MGERLRAAWWATPGISSWTCPRKTSESPSCLKMELGCFLLGDEGPGNVPTPPPKPPLLLPRVGSSSDCSSPSLILPAVCTEHRSLTGCLSASLPEGTLTISVTVSFFFFLSRLGYRKGLRTWPTGNFTKRILRRRRLTLPPCLDMGISHR